MLSVNPDCRQNILYILKNTDSILNHFQKYLGPGAISSTTKDPDTGEPLAVKICLFNNKPVKNAFTLATLGLSNTLLYKPDKTPVRHEVLFCAHKPFLSDEIYSRLFDFIDFATTQDESITLGMLFDFETPISSKSSMEAFVFYEPGYFDDEIFVFKEMNPPVIMAWAIPIYRKELQFIEEFGPNAFDELLAEHDPDLLDLSRESIVK